MRQILSSWELNIKACDIREIKCLPKQSYFILSYWNHNVKNHYNYNLCIRKSLYWENNKINKDNIIRSLTK